MYYVYILTNCSNKVLYTGITNNLERRLYEHKNKLVKGFTEKYNVYKLVYMQYQYVRREPLLRLPLLFCSYNRTCFSLNSILCLFQRGYEGFSAWF